MNSDTMNIEQPIFNDCKNCGTCDHRDYKCPCSCHKKMSPEDKRAFASIRRRTWFNDFE